MVRLKIHPAQKHLPTNTSIRTDQDFFDSYGAILMLVNAKNYDLTLYQSYLFELPQDKVDFYLLHWSKLNN